jgi:hypothetical protein
MVVMSKRSYVTHKRQSSFQGSNRIARHHSSEWVSERGLRSRDFESIPAAQSAEEVVAADKSVKQSSWEAPILRTGRGSLRGKLVITADWDSDEVNDAIARDFGLES